ncbi:MAG: hypothetical protein AB1801_05970, partial [Chloroflexota bacterium]
MRSIRMTLSLIALPLALGLILALNIYAQEPVRETGEEEGGGELSGLGLVDPPPAGYSVLYMFTGVANDSTDNDQ